MTIHTILIVTHTTNDTPRSVGFCYSTMEMIEALDLVLKKVRGPRPQGEGRDMEEGMNGSRERLVKVGKSKKESLSRK